jgi:predicted nuclease of predicted toxin-antitoxin system
MKILFDQGTLVPLRRFLPEHTVDTAYEKGWSALTNGDLILAAETEQYDVLITTDQNLRYQQN